MAVTFEDLNGGSAGLTEVQVSDIVNGTDGELITWDADGVATTVSVGTSGQVLTSNGAGAAPTFQTLAAGGKVLQVVSATKTDTATIASSTFSDSGLSATITPANTANKIIVLATCSVGGTGTSTSYVPHFDVRRGTSTSLLLGDAASNRTRVTASSSPDWSGYQLSTCSIPPIVDSPSTTSATTYYLYWAASAGSAYMNRTNSDIDAAGVVRGASSMILIEIDGT